MAILSLRESSIVTLIVLLFFTYRYYSFRRRLPPGPLGLPFIGNLHQAPQRYPWRVYAEWHKKYGPIFSLQYGPTTYIMLGNHQTAHELLDRRSNIYSSRPRFPFMGECVSDGKRILLLPYGDTFRAYRKMQAGFVSARVSDTYRELQDVESKQLVHEFLTTSDFSDRFHRYSSSLMFALAYGKRMPEGDEPEVTGVDKIMRDLDVLFSQRWLVDYLPFLNILPPCLAQWKYTAQKMRKKEVDYFHDVGKVAEQSQAWNWTKEITASKDSHNLTPSQVAYAVGNTYEAASDTTTIVLEAFIMAAVLHPNKMRTAQEELDRVVGRSRLPTFDDMDQLPYIRAVVKEVHRWRPVIPGGVPHAVMEDDVYNGYLIPKNSTVIGNHWAISMDPAVYGKPEEFIPERWLENPELPPPVTFGFGRRKCIGQYIANNSVFINVSRLLWSYNIMHAYDIGHDGRKIKCEVDPMAFVPGFNSGPLPFRVEFVVRGREVKDVVEREWNEAEKDADILLERIHQAQIRLKK